MMTTEQVFAASFVLKIFSAEQVHRVLVGPQTSFHSVRGVVETLVPEVDGITLLFSNAEAVATPLTKASFSAFLQPALLAQRAKDDSSSARVLLRLLVVQDEDKAFVGQPFATCLQELQEQQQRLLLLRQLQQQLQDEDRAKQPKQQEQSKHQQQTKKPLPSPLPALQRSQQNQEETKAERAPPRRRLQSKLAPPPPSKDSWQQDLRDLDELLRAFGEDELVVADSRVGLTTKAKQKALAKRGAKKVAARRRAAKARAKPKSGAKKGQTSTDPWPGEAANPKEDDDDNDDDDDDSDCSSDDSCEETGAGADTDADADADADAESSRTCPRAPPAVELPLVEAAATLSSLPPPLPQEKLGKAWSAEEGAGSTIGKKKKNKAEQSTAGQGLASSSAQSGEQLGDVQLPDVKEDRTPCGNLKKQNSQTDTDEDDGGHDDDDDDNEDNEDEDDEDNEDGEDKADDEEDGGDGDGEHIDEQDGGEGNAEEGSPHSCQGSEPDMDIDAPSPCQLWPPTPESTPCNSPRTGNWQSSPVLMPCAFQMVPGVPMSPVSVSALAPSSNETSTPVTLHSPVTVALPSDGEGCRPLTGPPVLPTLQTENGFWVQVPWPMLAF